MIYLHIYNILNILLIPIAVLNFVYRLLKGKIDLKRVKEKLGFGSIEKLKEGSEIFWIHAASIGETFVALRLIEELYKPNRDFIITTCTITSAEIIAKRKLPNVIHQYAPCDLTYCVNKFLNLWKPKVGIFIESEIWPNLIYLSSQRFKIALVNARISDKSYNMWLNFKGLVKFCLSRFSVILAQTKEDALKFQNLGAHDAIYAGNIKYSILPPKINAQDSNNLIKQIGERKILLAASTHEGDEEFIIKCYKELKNIYHDLLLIIAPRHPIRSSNILDLLEQNKLHSALRSKQEKIGNQTDVYLADTLGELTLFYSISQVSFIGGSLKNGGHNLLEASFFQTLIVFGPDMSNFKEIAAEYLQNNAAMSFENLDDAIKIMKKALSDKEILQDKARAAKNMIKNKQQVLPHYIKCLNGIV